MLEAVINVSEGRRADVVEAIAAAAGPSLLDVHVDADHHRSVLTLAGADVEDAAFAVATEAVARIDLGAHHGVHPRLGAVDVVPFVPLAGSSMDDAVAARDRFASRAAAELGLPVFLYGPERSLPEIRRAAFISLAPDAGPDRPHPTAGAVCAGARPYLVAFNVWLAPPATVADARRIARELRGTAVRALGLDVGGRPQVSCNLIDPFGVGPAEVADAVAARAPVARCELVGLLPDAVLQVVPTSRWAELDLTGDRTIEARLRRAAGPGGRGRPGPAPEA